MPNPRVMENYTPGVDDDPSSFTSYNVAEPAPQPPVTDEPLQGRGPPPTQPDPVEPYKPVVSPMPAYQLNDDAGYGAQPPYQPNSDVEFGSKPLPGGSVQTPVSYPKQLYPQGQYPGDSMSGQDTTESSNKFKKWMIIAIVGVLILAGVVVVVAVLALGKDDGGGTREIKQSVPNTVELRRAVDAVLSGNGLEGIESMYGPIGDWDVSNVKDFSSLFDSTGRNSDASTAEFDLSRWNVGSGITFFAMFQGAAAFNSDISGWDVSRATDFSYAFAGATSFNQDLSSWNMRQVTTVQSMFQGASSFNQDVSSWELDSLVSMSSAFEGATAFSQDLCAWGDVLASGVTTSAAFTGTSCPEADRAINLTADPAGPLCFSCENATPTGTPTIAPTTQAPTGPKLCFASPQELSLAVDVYLTNSSDAMVLDTYGPIGSWCVSGVTDFDNLFDADRNPLAATFNEDISGWDVSNAESMFAMFEGARGFNQDLSGWQVSRVIDFGAMFNNATLFNSDVSGWDTSSAVAMNAMFYNATRFDQDLSGWNVGSVQFFNAMFAYAESFSGDVSGWDVGSGRTMFSMFFFCPSFSSDVSAWDTSRVTDLAFTFALTTGFNSDVSSWNVAQVTTLQYTFAFLPLFNSNISSWEVQNVENLNMAFLQTPSFRQNLCPWGPLLSPDTNVEDMFLQSGCPTSVDPDFNATPPGPFCFDCGSTLPGDTTSTGACFLTTEELFSAVDAYLQDPSGGLTAGVYGHPIGSWCVSEITTFDDVFNAFRNPLAATFNEDLSGWDTSNALSMFRMFYAARTFNQDLSSWNTAGVLSFMAMFTNCTAFNGNISNWDTSSALEMDYMFNNATSFTQDLSGWDVSSVESFSWMFAYAELFTADLSGWNVGSGTEFDAMFYSASLFSSNLSTWDMSQAGNLFAMFAFAPSFSSDLSDWNVAQVTRTDFMFTFALEFNSDLSGWAVGNVENMYKMFQFATSFRQNLCPWGSLVGPGTDVTEMFGYTACPDESSPLLTANSSGPFCFTC
uniref:BspA family leucine-rich repeat surface protein n=1 Tax=Amphora coffeiformis TaxID=265554 RepID=A0A7S3LE04_9STRA|mmetsp:Transcript_24498/g.46585  ORF Transcript_24498/g.46585 Transcript_24498/m.46585 type:complete len:1019 (+) Transcript_24498:138-3194(+)